MPMTSNQLRSLVSGDVIRYDGTVYEWEINSYILGGFRAKTPTGHYDTFINSELLSNFTLIKTMTKKKIGKLTLKELLGENS